MTNKDLKNLPVTELIHCDGCGGYHTLEDSEVVIIRMIKGKGCQLKGEPAAEVKTVKAPEVIQPDLNVQETQSGAIGSKEPGFKEDAPGEGYRIPPKELEILNNKPRKNIIPPGLASMMIRPDSADFETKGAKEVIQF